MSTSDDMPELVDLSELVEDDVPELIEDDVPELVEDDMFKKEVVDAKSLMYLGLKRYLAPHHCVSWSASSLKGSIFFTLDLSRITESNRMVGQSVHKHISIPVVKSTSFCDYRDLTKFMLDVSYQATGCTEIVPSFRCKEQDPKNRCYPGCVISYHQSFNKWPTKLVESCKLLQ